MSQVDPSSSLTGALRGGGVWTQTRTRGVGGRYVETGVTLPETGRPGADSSLAPSEGAWPCPHLDFGVTPGL